MTFDTAYTADLLRNVQGGQRIGGTYLDNLDLLLSVDGERLWNVPLRLFAYGLYNNSRTFSDRYVGDAHVVSNIDAPRAIRLYEAWGEVAFGDEGAYSVRAGLYDLNSEFDASEARQLFINSAFGIGTDLSQSGLHGPSIFPVTSLGIRTALRLDERWQVLTVVLDGVPGDPDDSSATTIRISERDGALVVAELQRTDDERAQKLALGAWYYTSKSDALTSEAQAGRRHNQGFYLLSDWTLSSRWRAFVRLGAAQDRVNDFDRFFAAGIAYQRPTSHDTEESFGVALARAQTSDAFRTAAVRAGESIRDHESVIELTWRRRVSDWLIVQPDVQYVVNPGVGSLSNAWIIGLRVELSWSYAFDRR